MHYTHQVQTFPIHIYMEGPNSILLYGVHRWKIGNSEVCRCRREQVKQHGFRKINKELSSLNRNLYMLTITIRIISMDDFVIKLFSVLRCKRYWLFDKYLFIKEKAPQDVYNHTKQAQEGRPNKTHPPPPKHQHPSTQPTKSTMEGGSLTQKI